MTDNNDTSKNTEVTTEPNISGLLASRWDRLGAALIDIIISMFVLIPITYFAGGFDGISQGMKPSLGYNLLIGVTSIVSFALFHGKLLVSNGQTIGKKAVGIKIVDLNGNLPTLKEHLLKRYTLYFLRIIPVVGPYISTVNILFIFRGDKRCLHDLIAGTKVVNC